MGLRGASGVPSWRGGQRDPAVRVELCERCAREALARVDLFAYSFVYFYT